MDVKGDIRAVDAMTASQVCKGMYVKPWVCVLSRKEKNQSTD
jgi:hypothetical protein